MFYEKNQIDFLNERYFMHIFANKSKASILFREIRLECILSVFIYYDQSMLISRWAFDTKFHKNISEPPRW